MTTIVQTKRLAFWRRVSTEDRQDAESSRGWQVTRARSLIEPHGGQIVAEFFHVDKPRSIPPQRQPRAKALIEALAGQRRGFEAAVVSEPQRAFYGNQLGDTSRSSRTPGHLYRFKTRRMVLDLELYNSVRQPGSTR
jgi:hypothetical protein